MRKKRQRSPSSAGRPSTEQQLVGLRTHTETQKQATVARLRTAILSLETSGQPISARTIQEKCGLEYASIRRNPEALALYQQHSTFLQARRKRKKQANLSTPPRDPLLAYTKLQLVTRLREEQAQRARQEAQHTHLLEEFTRRDVKIAALEAELGRYRSHLAGLRFTIQQQEHQG